ncbi:MAG: hypothetical protein HOP12_13605 [Candidatus Eisenbacteria bacterium]|uniref:YfhO family protein n=1 Tax=Eiseniibacteriota bacterium TaxID=2212470 RepID=A0A849SQH8_UNCEI|nr:hypothetical protein [Candidatus Eisenbacteria bacterium]
MTKKPAASRPISARPAWSFDIRVVAAILGLLTLALFHEVALEGMTFASPDANNPAGFVRPGEEALKHGEYPLWNPYVFLGMPSFASGGYNPYIYPPDWPLALVERVIPLPSLTWMLLYYFLGACFAALLAREWGARPGAAMIVGALFAFTPNLVAVGSHGHGSQLVDSAYLPLLLWLASRWLRRGSLRDLGWLALAGGFQMLRGHAQIVFYTWMAVGLYLLVDLAVSFVRAQDERPLTTRLLRAAGIGAAMLLAFGLAGFYNLPLRDYAQYSIRGGGVDGGVGMQYATFWSLAPYELGTFVIPHAVGFGGATYWGGMPFTDYPNAFIGVVALALCLPALFVGGAPRVFALVLALFSLFVAFGSNTPVYGLLYQHLPLFNKFRVPVMIVLLTHLAVALAAGWGWTRVLEERDASVAPRRFDASRVLLAVALIGALVLVAAIATGEGWRTSYVADALRLKQRFQADAANYAFQLYLGDVKRLGLFAILVGLLGWAVARRRVPALLGSFAMLLLVCFEVWPVDRAVMTPVIGMPAMNDPETGRDDVVRWLESNAPADPYRILPYSEYQSNRFATFKIASLGGYHAAKPRAFQDLIERDIHNNLNWQRLLNIRYIVVGTILDSPGLVERIRGQSGIVYENLFALPRATVVGRYRVAPVDTAMIDSISYSIDDVANLTWLDRDPGLTLGPVEGATAKIANYGLNRVTVDVETPGPALLRLADAWYPDWVATVDGRPTAVLRADYALRAVEVPAGKHRVEFRFESKSVRLGLTLSFVSLTVILLLLLAGFWTARRRRTGPEPGAA